jgi:pyroglutamyl-peptidase
MARTLVIAGFGRFPGAPVNPSAVLVARLARIRRPALADFRRVTHVFATTYACVDRELPALIAREEPDAVVLFGVAPKAKRMRIELLARNRMSLVFPDADGCKPSHGAIERGGPSALTGMSPARLRAAARTTGAQVALSRHAGTYLCNYAYWRALKASRANGGACVSVFVHVPPLRAKPTRRRKERRPPLTLAAMTRAASAMLICAAAVARGRSRPTQER